MVEGQEWAVEGADEESKNDEMRVRKLTQWGIGVITLLSQPDSFYGLIKLIKQE